MKRKISILVLCFILLFSPKAFAATGPEIEAIVNGTVENGQTIQILINIKDIKSFFAGAMEFKYDKNVLKVKSIELGDLISKADVNKFDAMNKIDDKNGIAAYGFSCLGKVNGFSGTGTFVKINAEVLKKDSFHVRSKAFLASPNDDFNLKLQICDSNIKELEYSFKPYEFNLNGTNGSNSSNNTSNSTSTSTSNAGGSTANPNTENSSASNNTSTAAGTSSPQNNASKTTTAEEKNDKTIVQKIISAVENAFNSDKKDDSKQIETENKTVEASGNTETQNKSENTNKNSEDKSKSNEVNNTVTSNKNNGISNISAIVLSLVILMGAAVVLYVLYRRKSRKKL